MTKSRIKIFLFTLWGTVVGLAIYIYFSTKKRFVPRLTCKIQSNGFLTVLIMRLTFLLFDLVGYSSGMCNIRQKDFALATMIGTIPGLLTFVFLGGSLSDLRYLILAATFLTIGLTVSLWLKKTLLIENLIEKG